MPVKKLIPIPSRPPEQIAGLDIFECIPSELLPHPRNVRVHPEDNIQAIMTSLKKFGQRTPIVVWQNTGMDPEKNFTGGMRIGAKYILKGNGTHEAIKRLGWNKIYYVSASHLSPPEAEAYAIADNKTGDMSHFDFSKLADVMRDMEGQKIDLESTGFRSFELEPLLQATFDAGPKGELPTEEEIRRDGKTIKFTGDQYELVKDSLEKIRECETEFDVSTEAAAVSVLCYRLVEQRLKWKTHIPF